jgi:DNA repair protein RecO (recombination protein O)
LRPVLIPGNLVAAEFTRRGDARLPSARVELVASRGPWLAEPLPSAGIAWACALTAAALPEGLPLPAIHTALAALLDAICLAPSARGWARALAGYEALLLREVAMAWRRVRPKTRIGPRCWRGSMPRDRRLQANCLPNGGAMLWRPARFCSNG